MRTNPDYPQPACIDRAGPTLFANRAVRHSPDLAQRHLRRASRKRVPQGQVYFLSALHIGSPAQRIRRWYRRVLKSRRASHDSCRAWLVSQSSIRLCGPRRWGISLCRLMDLLSQILASTFHRLGFPDAVNRPLNLTSTVMSDQIVDFRTENDPLPLSPTPLAWAISYTPGKRAPLERGIAQAINKNRDGGGPLARGLAKVQAAS